MTWRAMCARAYLHGVARPPQVLLHKLIRAHGVSELEHHLRRRGLAALLRQAAGSLRTSTRTDLRRARVKYLQGLMQYFIQARGLGSLDTTSVQCLFSMTPLPGAASSSCAPPPVTSPAHPPARRCTRTTPCPASRRAATGCAPSGRQLLRLAGSHTASPFRFSLSNVEDKEDSRLNTAKK